MLGKELATAINVPPKTHQLRYLRVLFDNKFAKR